MTQRQIDLALLAGIGVLLVALLFLALSAAPLSGGDIGDPIGGASQVRGADEAGPAATEPVVTGTDTLAAGEGELGEGQAQTGDALDGSEVTSDTATVPAITPATTAEPATGPDVETNTATNAVTNAGTAPEGEVEGAAAFTDDAATDTTAGTAETTATDTSVEATGASSGTEERLERVGFAFVTSSMGACGVPLQPWQHVAVSRDLLDRYGCGATVVVTLADEVAGRQQVTAQIGDTMGAEIAGTVNIFVAQDEPALEYGVTEGALRALSGSQ